MTILPLDPISNATPTALRSFLSQCQQMAVRDQRPKLVSISIAVEALDPLAVLESIFEPGEQHFYAERPSLDSAIAGAEAVVMFEAKGPGRFSAIQSFIDQTLSDTIAVGDVGAAFGGPHFFTAFAFSEQVGPAEPFPAARVFVPRWQVARAGGRTTAVANLLVTPDAPLDRLAEKVWRAHEKFREFDYSDTPPSAVPVQLSSPVLPELSADQSADHLGADYRRAVERALRAIESGEFNKIVLARTREIRSTQPLHPLRMLNGLRQRFPDCYAFSIANGKGQSFIGATPERLARVSKGVLETEALAGSAPRGKTATEDAVHGGALLRSEKDRREQKLVLDSICRRLQPLGLNLQFPSEPSLRKLANVQHLQTSLTATLPDSIRLLDVIARLHPTPAVGGSPREAAVARLPELEGFSRGLYAGALGWINARGGGEFFVGLRSALVDGSVARLYAGAGIVAGSSPEKEFAETELKFRAIQEALVS